MSGADLADAFAVYRGLGSRYCCELVTGLSAESPLTCSSNFSQVQLDPKYKFQRYHSSGSSQSAKVSLEEVRANRLQAMSLGEWRPLHFWNDSWRKKSVVSHIQRH
jgi:hypothetical protein